MNKYIDKNNCTACGMCAVVCTISAISFDYSTGFPEPVVDLQKCTNCGLCMQYCTKYKPVNEVSDAEYFAAWSNNPVSRKASTSGGFAYEATKYLMENYSYQALGVKVNLEGLFAENYLVKDIEDLEKSRGSKYITSHMLPALNEIKQTGIRWVIVGTPCQINALDHYFTQKGRRSDAILIDMLCAGPANELLFKKYVHEKCAEYSKTLSDIAQIRFRDKSEVGWSATMKVIFKDGTGNKIKHSDNDEFFSIFFSRASQKDACYRCMQDKTKAKADIRIADFWGSRFKGNTEGVSVVVALTEVGKNLVKELSKEHITIVPVESEEVFQKQLDKPQRIPRQRRKVLRCIADNTPLNAIQKKYIKKIKLERKIRDKLRRTLGKSSIKMLRNIGKIIRT